MIICFITIEVSSFKEQNVGISKYHVCSAYSSSIWGIKFRKAVLLGKLHISGTIPGHIYP